MSRFTRAIFEYTGDTINGRVEVQLCDDLVYEVGYLGSGWTIKALKGLKSDGVSIPVIVLRFMPAGRMVKSAIIHDECRGNKQIPKFLGDYIFWEAMGAEGTPVVARVLAFLAVLVNGQRY